MPITFTGIHRVTHEESRQREADYWASRTMAERVIAGWELAEDNFLRQNTDEPEKRTAITLRRIPNSGR